jgi:hypothetical protein
MVTIPERFQIVGQGNVLMAGVHLLPLLGACAAGSYISGVVSRKQNNTSITLIISTCLQLLGIGLLTTFSGVDSNPKPQYVFQAIIGFGVGLSFGAATIMAALHTSKDDLAVAQGAVAQARVLGGSIGLAVCTAVFNYHIHQELRTATAHDYTSLLHDTAGAMAGMPASEQDKTRAVFAGAFTSQVHIMMFLCIPMIITAIFTWEWQPPAMARLAELQKDNNPRESNSETETEMGENCSVRSA